MGITFSHFTSNKLIIYHLLNHRFHIILSNINCNRKTFWKEIILTQLVHYSWLKVFLMNIFITGHFYVYESRFTSAMLYCSIIKVDFAALAASTGFSPKLSIWNELTNEKLFSPNHLTITLLFCTRNRCCELLGTSFKLNIWAGYQILPCLAQITSPGLNSSSSSSLDSSDSSVWPWSSSSWNWASSLLLESVFSISVRSSYSTFSGVMTYVLPICFSVLQSS